MPLEIKCCDTGVEYNSRIGVSLASMNEKAGVEEKIVK